MKFEKLNVDIEQQLMSSYEPVIQTYDRYFICFKLSAVKWATLIIVLRLLQIISIFVSGSELIDNHPKLAEDILHYGALYFISSFIIAPLWQNYSIVSKYGEEVDCWSCYSLNLCRLICKYNKCINKTDVSNKSDKSTTNVSSISRYIPLSIYNLWFIIKNKEIELNPKLPFDDMKQFGGMRSYLLYQQIITYGLLKYFLMIAVCYEISDNGMNVLNFSQLLLAISELKATFYASLFYVCCFMYIIVVSFFMCSPCLPCFQKIANNNKEMLCGYLFNSFVYFWNKIDT